MTKTTKKHGNKKNNTKKNKKEKSQALVCRSSYTPFEVEYGKTLPKDTYGKSGKKIIQNFLKQLSYEFDQSKITPQNDFYTFVNYRWLTDKEPDSVVLDKRQKYITQVDDFRIVQDKVYYQLYDIMKDYCSKNHNKLATCIKNFYIAAMRLNPIPSSKKYIKDYIQLVDEMRKDEKNIWKLLGYINRNEQFSHGCPFVWSVSPDDKNTKFYRSYITPQVFALVDLSVYYDDGKDIAYKAKYRKNYFDYCKLLFDTALGKGHGLDPKAPFEVQQELFNSFCNEVKNDEGSYHLVSAEDALKKYNFDWYALSKEIGYEHTPSHFVTSSLNYLKCGTDTMLKNWTSEKWRTYWIYIYLREIVRCTETWLPKTYNFYAGSERGQENLVPPEIRAALYTSLPFNTFLTNEYVSKYQDDSQIQFFEGMSRDLLEVFKRIIRRNTWLEPKTKKYALDKMDKISITIGSPKKLQPDPLLDYKPNEFIENINKIKEWRLKRFISLEGKGIIDIPMVDWTQFPIKFSGEQAYIVNASYTPSKNGIYVNLGYIQPPFIDLENRGIEYNLAHLGFTLSHEMSHALDDFGSQYDADGNLHDWWTPADKKKFKEIQKDVILQYHDWAKRDGINFDAAIGVGEDLADISGLAICDEYLRDFQTKNKDIAAIRAISYDAFYTYFAYQQRQKVTKKALAAQLKTNPHPLDKYRTNVPLSRSEVFRARYNIKPKDGMFWHNTNTIW
jgi:predicted metalloendopeptidase